MERLPHWVIPDSKPAFFDHESATAIEMVAKLYGKTNELIKDYNTFIDNINKHIDDYENGLTKDYEVFRTALRQEFQDFIDVIDLKCKSQDSEIANAVDYMKTNLRTSIRDMIGGLRISGELNDDIVACFDDFNQQIVNEKSARETADTEISQSITELSNKQTSDIENVNQSITELSTKQTSDIETVNQSITALEEQHTTDIESVNQSITDLSNKQNSDIERVMLELYKANNYVTPEIYGCVGDGITDDTEGFYNAINSGNIVLLAPNKTYNLKQLYELTNCFIVGFNSELLLNTNVIFDNTVIYNTKINVNYNNLVFKNNITFDNCDCYNGNLCIVVDSSGSKDVVIRNCKFHDNSTCDIYTAYNTENWIIEKCELNSSGTSHNIRLGPAYNCIITDNNVNNSAGGFGIVLGNANFCIIKNNKISNTYLEAINIHDSSNVKIIGNMCTWDDTHGSDFGISIYGQTLATNFNYIADNSIYNCAKAGINLERNCSFNVVANNIVQEPCRKYSAEDNDATSCCLLIRSEEIVGGCNRNVVMDNSFYYTRETITATIRDVINSYQNIIRNNTAINFIADVHSDNNNIVEGNNFTV